MKCRLIYRTLIVAAVSLVLARGAGAQSTSQDFPSPIISNEISGTIKARDLGDPRLTTYYYALNGEQGDLFINLVSRNFTGDIDVFTINGLRPMTKIVVYADYGEVETGRAIYLRRPEKLLLRIQGRTPNDDDAFFRLKFAGSFVAARAEDAASAPEAPRVSAENRGAVRVNSVGTILPAPPKPVETPDEKAKAETETAAKIEKAEDIRPVETEKAAVSEEARPKPQLVVTDPVSAEKSPTSGRAPGSRRRRPASKAPLEEQNDKQAADGVAKAEKPASETQPNTSPSFRTLTGKNRKPRPSKAAAEPQPDPLESISLVVQFKDGKTLEKKMSEVFKFSVDKGVLTVILKDGTVSRYPIVEVAKVTIE